MRSDDHIFGINHFLFDKNHRLRYLEKNTLHGSFNHRLISLFDTVGSRLFLDMQCA
jgi:hypothetical protein